MIDDRTAQYGFMKYKTVFFGLALLPFLKCSLKKTDLKVISTVHGKEAESRRLDCPNIEIPAASAIKFIQSKCHKLCNHGTLPFQGDFQAGRQGRRP